MKWFQHEEHEAIAAAVKAYRDGTQSDAAAGALGQKAAAGEALADRIEQALRSTDWRRTEAHRDARTHGFQKGDRVKFPKGHTRRFGHVLGTEPDGQGRISVTYENTYSHAVIDPALLELAPKETN